MKDYGVWHSIETMPKEDGMYLVASKRGTLMILHHCKMFYYPFNVDPQHPGDFDIPVCWAYIPDLSPKFTDDDVINGIKNGDMYY